MRSHPSVNSPAASGEAIRFAVAAFVLGLTLDASAATFNLRDYWDTSIAPAGFPAQSSTNPWTFHRGSPSGSLLVNSTDSYQSVGGDATPLIGPSTEVGTQGCSPGFCGASPADTRATFAGLWVHPGPGVPAYVVFHVSDDVTIESITVRTETIANGQNGNGIEARLAARAGGTASSLDNWVFTFANTQAASLDRVVSPASLQLAAGDTIELGFFDNGSYLFDHGNFDITITTGNPVNRNVPAPAAASLAAMAGAALLLRRRRQAS